VPHKTGPQREPCARLYPPSLNGEQLGAGFQGRLVRYVGVVGPSGIGRRLAPVGTCEVLQALSAKKSPRLCCTMALVAADQLLIATGRSVLDRVVLRAQPAR